MDKIKAFQSLADLFSKHNFSLYLVGGTVRDYLLNKELNDMDVVTEATPSELKPFLIGDYTFEKYGSVKVNVLGVKFDITTLRKEEGYSDSRHPNKVIFTKSLEEDVRRRDITINALYMDKDLNVIDLVDGQKDLSNHLIRMIGDSLTRINEDPLRIVRIYRFKLETGFDIEENLEKVLKENIHLLSKINTNKIVQEINKSNHRSELLDLLKEN